jgi:hypothetical protein
MWHGRARMALLYGFDGGFVLEDRYVPRQFGIEEKIRNLNGVRPL